jgi:hypothetical protein
MTTTQPPPFTYRLGPVSQSILAGHAAVVDALADALTVETRLDDAAPFETPPDLTPNGKLRKAAARGIAIIVASHNPQVAGVRVPDIVKRLQALGLDGGLALRVAQRLESSRALASVDLNHEQRSDSIQALLSGQGLTIERL